MNKVDKQYLELLQRILDKGVEKETRSGKVKSVFGHHMKFDLSEGLPILTTKKMFVKGVIYELLWFLNGDTNICYLVENGVNIWNGDAFRFYTEITGDDSINQDEFLEKVLNHEIIEVSNEHYHELFDNRTTIPYKFGDLGPIYGKQWRAFGENGVDQVQQLIKSLKNNPDDRRMIVTAHNPDVIDDIALPACHTFFQCYTRKLSLSERAVWLFNHCIDGTAYTHTHESYDELGVPSRELSLMFSCRSQDVPLGTPYNILSYGILTHMLAHITNMTVGELIYMGGDCHIYENQIEGVKEQLSRKGYDKLPKLVFNREISKIEDFKYEDFNIIGYESDSTIKFPLSVG